MCPPADHATLQRSVCCALLRYITERLARGASAQAFTRSAPTHHSMNGFGDYLEKSIHNSHYCDVYQRITSGLTDYVTLQRRVCCTRLRSIIDRFTHLHVPTASLDQHQPTIRSPKLEKIFHIVEGPRDEEKQITCTAMMHNYPTRRFSVRKCPCSWHHSISTDRPI